MQAELNHDLAKQVFDRADEVPACMEPGDLVIHHCLTIHRADPNPSNRHRRALGLAYNSKRARKDPRLLQEIFATVLDNWEAQDKL